jgi:putative Mn2+ efflux pump MntP
VAFIEVLLLAVAMAMDAFTVCLVVASSGQTQGPRPAFRLSFHFGLFQFIMPVLGWLAGVESERLIQNYDHWIAFALLGFVGLRMIKSALGPEDDMQRSDPSRGWMLLILSIAVSIDALAVGFTLGLLGVSVWYPAILIGVVTGGLSLVGLRLGRGLGSRLGKPFEVVGGLVLIGIGVRILIDHLIAI